MKILVALIAIFMPCMALSAEKAESLMDGPVPVPFSERGLPAFLAKELAQASQGNDVLEGAIMDKSGNLYFCNVSLKKVMKLRPDRNFETVVELSDLSPGGLAFHRDGRLFIAALNLDAGKGAILAHDPETGITENIIPVEAGFWPNDLVFSPAGGFYFSDFRGNATNPAGGIYYVDPDMKKIAPVIPNMAQANGVALSPDGRILWATEFAANRLHRAELINPVTIAKTGSGTPYYFTGVAPDSMRVDQDGNVHVALYGQGRALIFNQLGIPIGQILLAGREKGENLVTTSLAPDPGSNRVFLVTSNDDAEKGAKIFQSEVSAGEQLPQNVK